MRTIAIIGNPNVGKTELFNRLTGMNQRVGNWPGVTVEKKEGFFSFKDEKIKVVDLPGVYGLTARSLDEKIARDFITSKEAEVIIDIVDSTNLERNLYLTLILIESGANVVLALNMWDIAKGRGIKIDVKKLERFLGIPVVPTVATTGEGIEELKERVFEIIKGKKLRKIEVGYGKEIEERIRKIEELIKEDSEGYPVRWLAVRLLEGDEEIISKFKKKTYWKEIEELLEEGIDEKIIEKRYEFCSRIVHEVVEEKEKVKTFTDLLDEVFLHKFLGIPIFISLLYAVFQFTFSFSAPFSDMIDSFFAYLGEFLKNNIENELLASFLSDAVCSGVGSVLVFVPPIFCLFFALSLLENSGYLARAAFLMDKFLSKLGLHGKSFIPMLLGFGCNVPAIMATRTIENEDDRIITIMVNPLMSCSARLPVYVLISGVIFSEYLAGAAIFSMYLLGISLAILMALILRKFLFKGEKSPFILELPRYTRPKLSTSLLQTWDRGKWFLIKAGTFIFLVVVIVWFLSTFPWDLTRGGEIIEKSYIAQFGKFVEPIFKPLGWNWQAGVSLFFGFLAKEAVVGSIGTLLGAGEEGINQALMNAGWFNPVTGFAYMAFVLIYFPCVATLAVMLREMRARYVIITIVYTITLAFLVAFLIEGIGYLVGIA